jgi:hypothetical protein
MSNTYFLKCFKIVNKIQTILLISIFLLIYSTSLVRATTYYVDNVTGLDANGGLSTGDAWKTLSKATSIASAGDTVNVVNNGKLYPFRERLSPARSGTSGNVIKFTGFNGSPYLLGSDDYTNNLATGWIWHESSVSGEYYLTKNDVNPSITQPLVLATSLVTDWNIDGVDSLSNRTTGTIGSLSSGQWNWGNNDTLGYNTIYYRLASNETDITDVHIEGGVDGATRRNPVLVAWQYITIENFKVRFSNHHGILNQTLSNYVTYDNVDSSYTGRAGLSIGIFNNLTVRNSTFDHNGMISTVRADYSGINLSGTTSSTIVNNVISNGNNDSGINIKAGSSNNYIANNIIFNNSQHGVDVSNSSLNNSLFNNTLNNNGEQGINIETTSTGSVVKNNIMSNNQAYQLSVFDSGSLTGLVIDKNAYYFSNPATNMIRFVGSFYSMNTFSTYKSDKNQDLNSVAVNPAFANNSGSLNIKSDFKLLSSSALINAGDSLGIASDYDGNLVPQGVNPDIGAYEFLLPNTASSLSQYRSNGTTVITPGTTTTETTVVFKFAMSSLNDNDNLTPQIEIQQLGTPFTNTSTHSGDAVSYIGTPVTGVVTISGLDKGTSYHWQARVINSAGNGQWSQAGGNPDFVVQSELLATPIPIALTTSRPPSTSCEDPVPVSIPNLFHIDMNGTSAKLFFSPINNSKDFYISYSTNNTADEHSVFVSLDNIGVQDFTINLLKPNSNYYFKVRGQNGCATGKWSNIMSAKSMQISNNRSTPLPSSKILTESKKTNVDEIKPIAAPTPIVTQKNEVKKNVTCGV